MSGSRVVITADIAQALREFQRFRAQATGALEAVSSVGSKITGVLGAIGVSVSVAAFAGWIKGAIDATDAASDLSQKTGIAIKDLAGLELAYQMGGMQAEALASTQTKLAKAMVDGNEGLEQISITSRNLDGSMKSNKQVLSEVADRFANMQDGAQKTALAMQIFGKSGADMIPMLNAGSTGLREMDEMAAKLGLTLSEETVEQAGAFNDTLDLLMLGGQGIARGITAELLPTLSSLAGSFLTTMTQGDRLKNTAHFLATVLKMLYTVGVGVVEVFSTVGKTLGAAGAQLVALLSGDFRTAAQIGREWAKEMGSDWSSTAKAISDAWNTSGDSTVEAMAQITRSGSVVGKSAVEMKKQAAELNKERAEEAKILADLSGVTTTYMEDLSRLHGLRLKGKVTEEQYIDLVNQLIAKQPGARKVMDDAAKSMDEYTKGLIAANAELTDINDQVDEQKRANELIGLGTEALADQLVVRLENVAAQKDETAAALEAIEPGGALVAKYREQAAALRELASAKRDGSVKQTAADGATKLAADGARAAESIQQSLTDALMRGFESGKGFGKNFIDTMKNMFNTMVLRPVISAIVNPVAGAVTSALGLSTPASAATSAAGSGMGAGIGAGLGIGGAIAGITTGALQTAGAVLTGQIGLGSTLSAGLSAIGTGTASGLMAGFSSVVGALGPIALALGAAVMIWKKLDTSGTYHTGGAAMASSSGTSGVTARSLNMEAIRSSTETQSLVSSLAQGVVGILDSTALAFGKTAGYTAATAFADDTSKDGAWGALVIQKLGQNIVNWQDTRGGGKWAPKTFADGKQGQEQYLAALTSSVRTALDSIGLPEWARTMLAGVASNASLDDLAKVVDQINTTQRALKMMGDSIAGFANMSDTAISKLIAAAGGIEGLAAGASSYYQNFYTQGERLARTGTQVAEALAVVGLQMPSSRAAYRALVEQQMALGESGAPAVAVLLRMNESFAALHPELEAANDALRSQADILSERANLQRELDTLTMTGAQLRAQERAALDESNRALFDQVVLQRDLKASTEAASDALRDTVERLTATRESSLAYRDSLKLGSLSALTPMQKYMEAQRQYNDSVQRALASPADSVAVSRAQEAATAWLTASQTINASSAAFLGDKSKVLNDMDQLAAIAGIQMTDAQRQLSALDKQVLGISQLNDTAAAIQQAIVNQGAPVPMPAPTFDVQRYAASSNAAADVLAAEVKALRADNAAIREANAAVLAELKLLRTDANRNAGDIVEATEGAGGVMAAAASEAIEKASHRATNPTRVAPR